MKRYSLEPGPDEGTRVQGKQGEDIINKGDRMGRGLELWKSMRCAGNDEKFHETET